MENKINDKLSANEAFEALVNNSLDWYIVEYQDGTYELKHQSALSSILECGADPADWELEHQID